MTLVLDWQKKLGYTKDPFEGIMLPASKFLVGMSEIQERLNLFLIKEERFGTITGDSGMGKTLLLEWVFEELAPQKSHTQHFIDGKQGREEIVTTILERQLSFFERKIGKKLKLPEDEKEKELLQRLAKESKNVLLVDNAGSLGRKELELLADVVVKTPTYIVIADTEERIRKLNLPETLIDKLKVKMPSYTTEQLAELLKRRLEAVGGTGTFPFDDAELASLIKKSEKNPSELLGLARERAIELSLKVTQAVQAAPQVKEGSFFSIKIQKVDKSRPEETFELPKVTQKAKPEPGKVEPAVKTAAAATVDKKEKTTDNHDTSMSPAASADMDLLTQVLEKSAQQEETPTAVMPEKTAAPARKTKHDKVVEHMVEEFSKKPKKAKKKK